MNGRISRIAACLLLLFVSHVAAADEPATDKLTDGWRKEVEAWPNGKCIVSVEQGWLKARRQTASGEVEWQIVLAKVTDTKPPEVIAVPSEAKLTINYLGGKYFIREHHHALACVREAKPADPKKWPALSWPEEGFTEAGLIKGEGSSIISAWKGKSWLVAAAGPANGSFDVMMRLDRLELSNNGPEFGGGGGLGLTRIYNSDVAQMLNNGELLMAVRRLPGVAEHKLTLKNLVGSPAPEIEGKAWFNTAAPVRLSDLRGKVVLVDFWGTWCPDCVAELPRVQEVFQKYKDQGFVVIGVHSKQDGDQVESFLKEHKVDFPIVVDDDKTTTRYAVTGCPTYFLVDCAGKVVWGFENEAPKDEKIEELLKGSSSSASSYTTAKEPEPPKIYDAEANGAQQIAEALAKAGKDNKRVLLQFGANWSGWCQKLHTTFETEPVAAKLKSDFVVVMIDVDKDRNADVNKKYGQPTRFGLPAIVILDAQGNQLTTKNTSDLDEGDSYSKDKVLEFLNEWTAKK